MGGGNGGGGSSQDAKHVLDEIGENVYKEIVGKKAVDYRSALQGHLSQATFPTRQGVQASHVSDPCDLIYEYDTNVTGGFDTNNPCANRLDVRFSDKYGGQCTDTKIHGNENNEFGACAPFRRLFLCDHHLSHMKAENIDNKHNLLLEVLLAAKYEGQSLVEKYNEYNERHNVFPSDICTVLARSFADIGDIIRGKDLFIGYNEKDQEEKRKLQENLKKIFAKIYNEVTSGKTNGTNVDKAKARYGIDPNYYQLREDWWYANRETVWKTITCGAGESDKYFRQTCVGGNETESNCRCVTDVPTYFDYVPQYLRWFEEWGEDFCRLRKHKLKDIIKKCRFDENKKERYCDLNGFDCEKTIRGKNQLVKGYDCHKCSVACTNFEPWIKNQQKEFEKQKNKYAEEIKKADGTTIKIGNATINNLYVDEFYKKLKDVGYGGVEEFLKKLNNEAICKKPTAVEKEKASNVDFTNEKYVKTFDHKEYCDTCPWCATKKKQNGEWKDIQHRGGCPNNGSTHFDNSNTTNINLLSTNIAEHNILEKYKNFCKNGNKETENWQCYYDDKDITDVNDDSDNCIQGDWNNFTKDKTIKPYELFFSHWIKRMLEDSIKWREQFNNCINNENATKCIKWCKTPCECYKKWVERMKEEWGYIKKHFDKQKNLPDNRHFTTLEIYLELEFLPSIEEAYGNDEAIEKIEELLEERRTHADSELKNKEKKDIIDYLLKHEEDDAEKCTTTHKDDQTCTEEEKIHNNPCSEHVNKPTASVKDIARKMKSNARRQLGISGRNALKGDAKHGHYIRGGSGDHFKNLCSITDKDSNDSRNGNDGEPCKGKDGSGVRMKIGTPWSKVGQNKTTYTDVYLPPRREHMCTSNLEFLETNNRPLDGTDTKDNPNIVNDSFLGDVLLSAKYEAKKIMELYKQHNGQNDHIGMCRAVRNSFADLGDIIRGRDMWDLDEGSKKMEKNLVTIFEKIKENIDDDDIKDKYTGDDLDYKQLRSDWWEANRHQVWNAMKCATRKHQISCPGMLVEDYIPQRLRWMTEWAEWFCKEQSQAYETLQDQCGSCMGKGKVQGCTKDSSDGECRKCKEACKKYGEKIKKWEDQWKQIKAKYEELYKKALDSVNGDGKVAKSTTSGTKDEKDVVDFLKQLLPENSAAARNRVKRADGSSATRVTAITPNTPYSTAAGYIHQELPYTQCQIQKHFCDDNEEKYVFKDKPHDHDTPCNCDKPPKKDACEIVEKILKAETEQNFADACALKYGKNAYHGWDCRPSAFKKGQDEGSCMPPRRQKLYVYNLNELKEKPSEQDLRRAFIKCAAVETFFAWHEFKKVKQKEEEEKAELVYRPTGPNEQDQNLKKGDIPEDFKRQMFYTFGDYKDIFFGKDMGKDMSDVENKIKNAFSNGGKTQDDKRKGFWDSNGKDIWEGMLCALSYNIETQKMDEQKRINITSSKNKNKNNNYKDVTISSVGPNGTTTTTLSKFTEKPQYIRWFEEWSEEFCRKRKIKIQKIKNECRGDTEGKRYCSGDGHDCEKPQLTSNETFVDLHCRGCGEECIKYEKWIVNKRHEFDKQKNKCEEKFNNYLNKIGYSSAEDFLASLNHCKHCESNSDQSNKIDFKDSPQTFGHSTYCTACPVYGVNCYKYGNCTPINEKDYMRRKGIVKQENYTNGRNIEVLVSSRKGDHNHNELHNACENADLFKDASVQNWECQKKYGIDQCNLKNVIEHIDIDKDISFNELFQRWLRFFVHDYNKLKDKINPCIKLEDGKSNKCIKGCKKNCECGKKWLKIKGDEWQKIKTYYDQKKKMDDYGIPHWVKSFFNQGPFLDDIKKAQHVVESEDERERYKLWGCTGANIKDGEKEKCNKGDFITNLISKLQNKIHECKTKHDETSPNTCDDFPPQAYIEPLDPDDHDHMHHIQQPKFCPQPPPPPLQQDACEMVKKLIKDNDGNEKIEECNTKSYNGWTCQTDKFENDHNGACMPPRRQSLCIHSLEHFSGTSQNKLKEAFIKCAAAETFFSWYYYKSKDGEGNELDNTLKAGTIPPEFLRSMFYTFGDYRDLCLNTDISSKQDTNKGVGKVKKNIDAVFSNDGQKNDKTERKEWWKTIENDVWDGMLCALEKVAGKTGALTTKYPYSTVKFSDDETTLETFAQTPQFLRWFTEWGDEFCRERVVKIKELKEGCMGYECDVTDETKKEACKKACEKYQTWLQGWKDQYEQQTAKFDKDKKEKKFENTSAEEDVTGVSSARDYLHEQLEKLCTNGDCSCMEETSTQDEEIELSGINDFPEALDYPPKENKNKCECAIPPEPMSCVEKTALQLKKIAEKNVKNYESSLKGTGNKFNGTCNLIEKQNSTNGEYSCEFKKRYPNGIKLLDSSCYNNGNERFKIGEVWECDENTADGKKKLCIPPRRKYMCLKKFEDISGDLNNDSTKLLQKIQDVAQNEGDDIIKNLLPENACNESIICDAMKYSFADLADIVRGTNIYKDPNGTNGLEKKLKSVFDIIYTQWKSKNTNNESKYPDLASFRSAWWDANRKEVWNAMTCNAPKDAELKKRINNPGSTESVIPTADPKKSKCAHDSEPPDYDYIPARYRFLQEWSEYYCKALKEKNNEMEKECPECLKKGTECEKEEDKKKCEECNKKCEEYKKFVHQWHSQFEEQNQLYKELYMKAKTSGIFAANSDSSIKFIQKLDKMCEDPHNAKKYLDKSTHCTDYKFSEMNNNENYYAFSKYPKGYKDKCKCHENAPSDLGKNVISFIQNSFKSPKVPGLNTIKKAVPRIPNRIKNIWPDAHTIHELVARTFTYFVPFFQTDDKTPPTHNILNDVLPSAIPVGIALALTSIAFLYLKKKTKSTIDLLRVINIPKSDYDIPTKLSPNRYIPYTSGKYRGKRYIYLEGDSGTDSGYTDHYSDITSSSESEYEELDINDIYVPGSPKYKTLIEVVLEPSGKLSGNTIPTSGNNTTASGKNTPSDTQNDIQNDGIPSSKITDNEWNTLKHDFISNMLQNEPNTEPNILHDNLDNNTHPTMSRDNMDEKPFITSIHDRNLYTGEEYNYDMSTNSGIYPSSSNRDSLSGTKVPYSGIDLINDALNGDYDIYDEVLKRKENELFGTNYKKNTSNNSVAKLTNSDPIMNQINLLHKWLDRRRNMCENWENKEDILNKLNEQWNKDNDGGDISSDSNKRLNTDVSIQIDMDDITGKKELSNMDTILDDIEDDIYYDVNDDENPFVDDIPMDHNKVDVPKKVHVEMKILNNTSNGSLEQEFPISDVWNI